MISFEYVKTTFSPDVVIRLQTLRRLARNTRKAAHGNLPAPFEVLLEGLEMRLLRQGSQAFLESYPIVFFNASGDSWNRKSKCVRGTLKVKK